MAGSLVPHRRQVEEETRQVLEAFLQSALSHGEAGPPGHVGRGYHDPQNYMHRRHNPSFPEAFQHWHRFASGACAASCSWRAVMEASSRSPTEHTRQCPAWNSVHEAINHVEENKHGFRTSIKRLLQRRPSPREPSDTLPPCKGGSLKRSKAACEGGENVHQKRTLSFKSLLRKKGASSGENGVCVESPQRPDSLPLVTCYCRKQGPQTNECDTKDAELFTLVAQKLDHLVKQQQQVLSPVATNGLPSPIASSPITTLPTETASLPSDEQLGELNEKQKEQILQKLITLLEDQAGVINKEIETDPLLRNSLSRMSYRSFSRLADTFISRVPPGVASPQLAQLALTMELTRKVAGINSHAVHTLMGYSMQYMDMFVPWVQQQGGWENIVTQEKIFDVQLD